MSWCNPCSGHEWYLLPDVNKYLYLSADFVEFLVIYFKSVLWTCWPCSCFIFLSTTSSSSSLTQSSALCWMVEWVFFTVSTDRWQIKGTNLINDWKKYNKHWLCYAVEVILSAWFGSIHRTHPVERGLVKLFPLGSQIWNLMVDHGPNVSIVL